MTWIFVAVGGALGAVLRYGLQSVQARWWPDATLPAAIAIANIAGSGAIGALAGLMASARWAPAPEVRAFVIAGLLGGFTTFSSFSLDTLLLARNGQMTLAAMNVGGQVTLSLIAAAIGFRLCS